MERLAPESQLMEETDSLGISALSLESAMSASLRGQGRGGMEMFRLPCVGTLEEDMQLVTRWHFIRPVGAFGDLSWLETSSVGLL